MSKLESVVIETMVRLVRQVPWGPSRDELLSTSKSLSREGSFERGWDNYTTAARLDWKADMFRLAGEARFPRNGDGEVSRFRNAVIDTLEGILRARTTDDDIGESTRQFHNGLIQAVPDLSDDELDELTDELASIGRIADPEHCKALRRGPEDEMADRFRP